MSSTVAASTSSIPLKIILNSFNIKKTPFLIPFVKPLQYNTIRKEGLFHKVVIMKRYSETWKLPPGSAEQVRHHQSGQPQENKESQGVSGSGHEN